jgi:prophage tail gpP-like protein/phage tail protein X
MSQNYTINVGDTFETIARKKYGIENKAHLISKANPGTVEPLTAGTVLTIPNLPNAPQNLPIETQSNNSNEVAILIDNKRFRFWDKIRINRSIDTMDTAEFGAPFESDNPGFKESFQPFSFKSVDITVGGDPLFKGTMIGIVPVVQNNQKVISVSSYSLPGVLNDCTPPSSSYPLEFNNQGLREIASAIAEPFGLTVDFRADQGAVFDRVACDPSKKALSFLIELAKQRNLIISSSQRGALVFWQSVESGSPVARMQQGSPPLLSVTPFFTAQEYYSHITGLEPVVTGSEGSQFTVKNPLLTNVTRPITFKTSDTLTADVKNVVEAKAGRMFGNMASYTIRVATWRDPNGALWTPNTTIKLLAPDAMIYTEYEFIIRSVQLNRERAAETATLNLVIPGSFSGKVPEVLPWDF